ncbi:MAG: FkbM family methyltransferase [Edaphocola sp.]
MCDTKKFNIIYNSKTYSNAGSVATTYPIKIANKLRNIHIRLPNGDISMMFENLWQRVYDIPQSLLPSAATIVDLGANVGFATLFFAEKYPCAKIIAVEPSKGNFAVLAHNTASFTNIETLEAAAYPVAKQLEFSEGALAYNSKLGAAVGNMGYTVQGIGMADLMANFSLTKIDLLKIDIEGAEIDLLRTNTGWLRNVGAIIAELHEPYNFGQFEQDLSPFGFKVFLPGNHGLKMVFAKK